MSFEPPEDLDDRLRPGNPDDEDEDENEDDDLFPEMFILDLRTTRVRVDRSTLKRFPNCLLNVMFPNGLIMWAVSRKRQLGQVIEDDDDDDTLDQEVPVIYADLDPACIDYVLHHYRQAAAVADRTATYGYLSPLNRKQPIIVLREELEYFCVPIQKSNVADMVQLKLRCGQYLQRQGSIFAALEKNIAKECKEAEQSLIDMLCEAGYQRDSQWGHRALEPLRTCITSISIMIVKMKGSDKCIETARKLQSFWHTPVKKCWWDCETVEMRQHSVRLWIRRTWALEMALV